MQLCIHAEIASILSAVEGGLYNSCFRFKGMIDMQSLKGKYVSLNTFPNNPPIYAVDELYEKWGMILLLGLWAVLGTHRLSL